MTCTKFSFVVRSVSGFCIDLSVYLCNSTTFLVMEVVCLQELTFISLLCGFPIFACLSFHLNIQIILSGSRKKNLLGIFMEMLTSLWRWATLFRNKRYPLAQVRFCGKILDPSLGISHPVLCRIYTNKLTHRQCYWLQSFKDKQKRFPGTRKQTLISP